MAKPRVFISSTYYDLRNVRSDLERFMREQGYEPIMFERGNVAYGAEERLEEDCYREISTCDILINLIGGKFGSESSNSKYSISQNELRTAVKLGKQIYIFIEKSVHAEYATYVANKNVKGFTPTSVNDIRVFGFIEEVMALSGRNPIQPFEISQDIVSFLREQWAGLFQLLLQEHGRQREVNLFEKIESTADTLNQLVTFLTEERSKGDQTVKDILLSNHPLFIALRKTMKIPYPIFFKNLGEMEALLNARKTNPISKKEWDTPDYREYLSEWFKSKKILKIFERLFEKDGKLKIITPDDWKDEYVSLEDMPKPTED
jgi:hypothetical protein